MKLEDLAAWCCRLVHLTSVSSDHTFLHDFIECPVFATFISLAGEHLNTISKNISPGVMRGVGAKLKINAHV